MCPVFRARPGSASVFCHCWATWSSPSPVPGVRSTVFLLVVCLRSHESVTESSHSLQCHRASTCRSQFSQAALCATQRPTVQAAHIANCGVFWRSDPLVVLWCPCAPLVIPSPAGCFIWGWRSSPAAPLFGISVVCGSPSLHSFPGCPLVAWHTGHKTCCTHHCWVCSSVTLTRPSGGTCATPVTFDVQDVCCVVHCFCFWRAARLFPTAAHVCLTSSSQASGLCTASGTLMPFSCSGCASGVTRHAAARVIRVLTTGDIELLFTAPQKCLFRRWLVVNLVVEFQEFSALWALTPCWMYDLQTPQPILGPCLPSDGTFDAQKSVSFRGSDFLLPVSLAPCAGNHCQIQCCEAFVVCSLLRFYSFK